MEPLGCYRQDRDQTQDKILKINRSQYLEPFELTKLVLMTHFLVSEVSQNVNITDR